MKSELKQKWIEALESGRYEKGVRALKGPDGYCCLGVLADITGNLKGEESPGFVVTKDGTAHYAYLPKEIHSELGLEQKNMFDLARINDKSRTFKEVVEYIKNEV